MTVDVTPPALSMQLGATRVARAHQEISRRIVALHGAIFTDGELSARERSRCETDARRILMALEQLEAALDAAAITAPPLFGSGERWAAR